MPFLLRAYRWLVGLPSWAWTVVAVVATGLAFVLRPKRDVSGLSLEREREGFRNDEEERVEQARNEKDHRERIDRLKVLAIQARMNIEEEHGRDTEGKSLGGVLHDIAKILENDP